MFKDILKKVRQDKKLTQKEVADALGISQPSYQQWENGKRSPSGETLEKLATYFNVSVDYLLGRSIRKFSFETNEPIGTETAVTFFTLEQANMVNFLSMLKKENQDKVQEYIFDLTIAEDDGDNVRLISYDITEEEFNRKQIGAISFVNNEQIERAIEKLISEINNTKQHIEKLSSLQDKRPIPQLIFDNLQSEIENKNMKIAQYEQVLNSGFYDEEI